MPLSILVDGHSSRSGALGFTHINSKRAQQGACRSSEKAVQVIVHIDKPAGLAGSACKKENELSQSGQIPCLVDKFDHLFRVPPLNIDNKATKLLATRNGVRPNSNLPCVDCKAFDALQKGLQGSNTLNTAFPVTIGREVELDEAQPR